MTEPLDDPKALEIPYGYCQCGCGQKTRIAPKTCNTHGYIRGEPRSYVFGHQPKSFAKPIPAVLIDTDPSKPWIKVQLSRGKVALIDRVDAPLIADCSWHAQYRRGYWCAKGVKMTMHQAIMGSKDSGWIDHKNGNALDNRRRNLRPCDVQQNNWNRKKPRTNTSGFIGVGYRNGKYHAQIGVNGRTVYLGIFDDARQAALAYDRVALEVRGEFARLNFPLDAKESDQHAA